MLPPSSSSFAFRDSDKAPTSNKILAGRIVKKTVGSIETPEISLWPFSPLTEALVKAADTAPTCSIVMVSLPDKLQSRPWPRKQSSPACFCSTLLRFGPIISCYKYQYTHMYQVSTCIAC